MKMTLYAIGEKMPDWIKQGFEAYTKRFPKTCMLELVQISSKKSALLWQKIPERTHVVALDERGQLWNTLQLAEQLQHWKMSGKNIAFIIGGAEGLDKTSLKKAHQCWSLSPLTLPHMLVRILVAEQLYRALSILSGHPYHRGT
jgi:23S rRNA (pseudouridine1915-N3)-methyltransferase